MDCQVFSLGPVKTGLNPQWPLFLPELRRGVSEPGFAEQRRPIPWIGGRPPRLRFF